MNAADWPPPVRLDIGEGIATLTLDRPASMNAVTTALAVALEQAVLVADRDDDVNVIVIRGAGGNFCAAATSRRSSGCAPRAPARCGACSSASTPPAPPSRPLACRWSRSSRGSRWQAGSS